MMQSLRCGRVGSIAWEEIEEGSNEAECFEWFQCDQMAILFFNI